MTFYYPLFSPKKSKLDARRSKGLRSIQNKGVEVLNFDFYAFNQMLLFCVLQKHASSYIVPNH
jgi:hypothetical protein